MTHVAHVAPRGFSSGAKGHLAGPVGAPLTGPSCIISLTCRGVAGNFGSIGSMGRLRSSSRQRHRDFIGIRSFGDNGRACLVGPGALLGG